MLLSLKKSMLYEESQNSWGFFISQTEDTSNIVRIDYESIAYVLGDLAL